MHWLVSTHAVIDKDLYFGEGLNLHPYFLFGSREGSIK